MKTIRNDEATAAKQLTDFKRMLEARLEFAMNKRDTDNYAEMDRLYENDFVLSFMGKTCRIAFGATEYYAVIGMLEEILEEMKQ